MRELVKENGYFKVIVPFTISKNTGSSGNYKCSAELIAKDFTPLKINGVSSKAESAGEGS